MARFIRAAATLIAAVAVGTVASPSAVALAGATQSGRPVSAQAGPAGGKTVVTFAWGGGLADQMPSLPIFRKYGMHATYFVASGLVCLQGQAACRKSSPYLTIGDLHAIAADGDEIGGLSVLHQQLTTMPVAEAKREICNDRSSLFRWGFRPTDFAYPFAVVNPAIEALTRECGYNAGLGTGTLRGAGLCNTCAWAETIPPRNPMNVRTPIEVNSVNTTWTARTYESIVTKAQQHGGGWIIFTIHDICPTDCQLGTTASMLGRVLKWLHGQAGRGTVVKTMRQVIGGPVRPAVSGPAPSARPPSGVVNANLRQATSGQPACFQEADYGGTVASFAYHPAGGPGGSGTETVHVSDPGSGNAKLLQALDLGLCAPSVTSGHAYTVGVSYKASCQTRMEVYRRTLDGDWIYWTTSPVFPVSTSWKHAAWTAPTVPPGTTAVSFGLTTNSAGTITTTDYSLKVAKSYRALILLAAGLAVILAAGLIARGHYRYVKYTEAQAAEAEAVNAGR